MEKYQPGDMVKNKNQGELLPGVYISSGTVFEVQRIKYLGDPANGVIMLDLFSKDFNLSVTLSSDFVELI